MARKSIRLKNRVQQFVVLSNLTTLNNVDVINVFRSMSDGSTRGKVQGTDIPVEYDEAKSTWFEKGFDISKVAI